MAEGDRLTLHAPRQVQLGNGLPDDLVRGPLQQPQEALVAVDDGQARIDDAGGIEQEAERGPVRTGAVLGIDVISDLVKAVAVVLTQSAHSAMKTSVSPGAPAPRLLAKAR